MTPLYKDFMLENTIANAVLALVENRPEDARSIVRSSSLGEKSSPFFTIQDRLHNALAEREKQYARRLLKVILVKSMRLECPFEGILYDGKDEESFLKGVKTVEDIIEDELKAISKPPEAPQEVQ